MRVSGRAAGCCSPCPGSWSPSPSPSLSVSSSRCSTVQYSTVQYSTVQSLSPSDPASELNIHSNITFVTEAIYNSSWIYENWIEGIIFNRIESAALQSKDISDFSPSQQNRHRQINSDVTLPPATM